MKKLIELDVAIVTAIDAVDEYDGGHNFERDRKIRDALMALPTVDAVPVAHSEWIPKEKADTPYGLEMECAKCGFSVIVNDALYFKFCPSCGARTVEGDDET